MPVRVDLAVEGLPDAAVAARLIESAGLRVGRPFIAGGKATLLRRLPGYNNAARFSPWLVIVDQDDDGPCPGALADRLASPRNAHLILRVAVREVESWIPADREGVSRLLEIPQDLVPREPDRLDDPKACLIGLAERSRSRSVRQTLLPDPGSGRSVGPGYATTMAVFAEDRWSVEKAADRSPSLARAVRRLHAYRAANTP